VAVCVPAGAVEQVLGKESYSNVPREMEPAQVRYVLATDTRKTPPIVEVHTADCWTIAESTVWRRITPIPDISAARGMLMFGDTAACTICDASKLDPPPAG